MNKHHKTFGNLRTPDDQFGFYRRCRDEGKMRVSPAPLGWYILHLLASKVIVFKQKCSGLTSNLLKYYSMDIQNCYRLAVPCTLLSRLGPDMKSQSKFIYDSKLLINAQSWSYYWHSGKLSSVMTQLSFTSCTVIPFIELYYSVVCLFINLLIRQQSMQT